MIGKEIHSYKIIESLGEGGMGSVFKAVHKHIPTLYAAIKFLHPALFSNESMKKKFQQEAAVLARLNHPYVVRLLDYAEDSQGMYLIMEYVDGRSLDQMIKKETGPIEEGRIKRIFSKILDAFQYAHTQAPAAIIHRDIKPSNILITSNDEPKIIDFGIVKLLEAEHTPGETQAGTKIGTPLFMSPEQIMGKPVDVRTDIYSLGVTLFHMATGKSPYLSTLSEYEILTKIVNEPLPKAKDLYPFVSDQLQSIIDKATQKDKGLRFGSCIEFKTELLSEQPEPKVEPKKAEALKTTQQIKPGQPKQPDPKSRPSEKIKSFKASKNSIVKGGKLELTWATDSDEPVVIKPVGTMKNASGYITVWPTKSTTYTLQTAGETRSLFVTVKQGVLVILVPVALVFLIVILLMFVYGNKTDNTTEATTTDSVSTMATADSSSMMATDTTMKMSMDTMKK